jgi:prepilin peptidase CpaA
MTPQIVLLLAACALAVYTDLRDRKIPNWLTAALSVAALVIWVSHGPGAAASAIAAAVVIFVLGTFAHAARILGGGDVKLLAAGSLAVGFPDCVLFIVYTFLGGGVLAIAFALAQHRLRSTLDNIRTLAQTRTLLDETAPSARMPYAIAIAFGAAAVALADTILPAVRFST